MDIKRYDKIAKKRTKDSVKINTHIPKPTDSNYRAGAIKRRFAQKTNDKGAPIYEVNGVSYRQLRTRPEYITVVLNWRISVPLSTQYDDCENCGQTSSKRELLKNLIKCLHVHQCHLNTGGAKVPYAGANGSGKYLKLLVTWEGSKSDA